MPERTAQLAIARIHGVPTVEVGSLGWPFWLYPYSRHVLMTAQPWHCGNIVDAFRGPGPGRTLGSAHQGSLTVTGSGLSDFLSHALTALAEHSNPWEPMTASSVRDILAGRVSELESMHREANGPSLEATVTSEFSFLAEVLAGFGNDGMTRSEILALLVRVSVLGAAIHWERSQYTAAEEYLLLAVRAAVAIGSGRLTKSCLADLAALRARAGEFADSHALRAAASAAFPGSRRGAVSGTYNPAFAPAPGHPVVVACEQTPAVVRSPSDKALGSEVVGWWSRSQERAMPGRMKGRGT
ncbi:hypothetical protein [Kitasatospora sp. NPDC059827]|uniref:hypothetical protein n=1 Tax=Kitasatospora sp. NPDC059827 TaxID=3346964 RepID=UPI0036524D34